MDKIVITLEDNVPKEVYSIFYLYNSKYYLIYTEKKIDENGYVILHLVQVGKEINTTPNGPVDTGNMIGVEISDSNEWKLVQESITKIVANRKNNTNSPDIKYLPVSMINNLKVISKKTFRLMKNVIEDAFGLSLEDISQNPVVEQQNNSYTNNTQNSVDSNQINLNESQIAEQNFQNQPYNMTTDEYNEVPTNLSQAIEPISTSASIYEDPIQQGDVIVDYRSRFFEEQSKNEQLHIIIDDLNKKIENIKKILE